MSIKNHLPCTKKTMLIQGRIDKDLGQKVRDELDRRSLSWPDFIAAACMSFLEEKDATQKQKKS